MIKNLSRLLFVSKNNAKVWLLHKIKYKKTVTLASKKKCDDKNAPRVHRDIFRYFIFDVKQ